MGAEFGDNLIRRFLGRQFKCDTFEHGVILCHYNAFTHVGTKASQVKYVNMAPRVICSLLGSLSPADLAVVNLGIHWGPTETALAALGDAARQTLAMWEKDRRRLPQLW